MKTIKVTQSASGKFAPDTATVSVEVKTESKKYGEAVSELNLKAEEIIKSFAAAALDKNEIRKSGASVAQIKRDGKTLFAARTEIKASLPITDGRMERVLAAAESSGMGWNSEYSLADKSYRNALAAEAVAAARASAQSIAAAAGVKLGELCGVEYAAGFGGGARLMRAAAFSGACAEPEDVEAVESVTCEWEIA